MGRKANGIKRGNELARAKIIIGDPLNFPWDKVHPMGKVAQIIKVIFDSELPKYDSIDKREVGKEEGFPHEETHL
eukprot:7701451-Ditylum_brightwellii.AAC.1